MTLFHMPTIVKTPEIIYRFKKFRGIESMNTYIKYLLQITDEYKYCRSKKGVYFRSDGVRYDWVKWNEISESKKTNSMCIFKILRLA